MKITLIDSESLIGQDDTGRWVQHVGGKWVECKPPVGTFRRRKGKRISEPVTPMTDPYKRKPEEVNMVTIRRVIEKSVPDYEAEVLVRNGWEYLECPQCGGGEFSEHERWCPVIN